jgi:uncharacterized protein (TIGR02246 family)
MVNTISLSLMSLAPRTARGISRYDDTLLGPVLFKEDAMTNPRLVGRLRAGVGLALFWCGIAIGCAPAPPADNSDEARAGIAAVNQQFMDAVERKDAPGIAALYTEDARILPPGSPPVEGRAAIEQLFASMTQGIGRLQIDTVELMGHGDMAHEQEALTFFDATGAKVDEGKAIVIWKKVGEDWRLHRDIFNSSVPPPAPAAPAEEGAPPAEPGATPAGDSETSAAAPPP